MADERNATWNIWQFDTNDIDVIPYEGVVRFGNIKDPREKPKEDSPKEDSKQGRYTYFELTFFL